MKAVILMWKNRITVQRKGHDLYQHWTQTTTKHFGSGQDSNREPAKHKSHACSWVNISITPQLTSRHIVLPEKLTGPHLVKKLPAFYGILKFITVSTTALHLSLPPEFKILKIHCNINLSFTIRSPKWSLSLRFAHQNREGTSRLTQACHVPRKIHSWFSVSIVSSNPLYPYKI